MQNRIHKEIEKIKGDESTQSMGISIWNTDSNLYQWTVQIAGPPSSPYSKGVFLLSLNIPTDYPFKAPSIHFLTNIYHPNVDKSSGLICHDIYAKDWNPVKTLLVTLHAIHSMLLCPQLDTPVEAEIAHQYSHDWNAFTSNVDEWISKYANK